MVVYDNPSLTAFEVDGALLGRRGLVKLIGTIPGATIRRKPKLFSSFREFDFCEFEVRGEVFCVEEVEINGRYFIAPRGGDPHGGLGLVRQAFCDARPFFGQLL